MGWRTDLEVMDLGRLALKVMAMGMERNGP